MLGRVIADRYRLDGILGRGGMGAVYAAVHRITHKRVAVKVLHSWVAEKRHGGGRFLREAQAAAAIGHPAIPQVLDAGIDEGNLYLVFEWLEGRDLNRVLVEDVPPSAGRIVDIAIEVLNALEAAHSQDFVHRDIKPGNIFLHRLETGQEVVKLLDFGASKRLEGPTDSLTRPGAIIGTPHYMSPEQALGQEVDGRADLWALGATMFRALVGTPPFVASSQFELLHRIAHEHPPSLAICPIALPEALIRTVDRALEPDISRRWPNAHSMRQALEACPREVLATTRIFLAPGPQILEPGLEPDRRATDCAPAPDVGTAYVPAPVFASLPPPHVATASLERRMQTLELIEPYQGMPWSWPRLKRRFERRFLWVLPWVVAVIVAWWAWDASEPTPAPIVPVPMSRVISAEREAPPLPPLPRPAEDRIRSLETKDAPPTLTGSHPVHPLVSPSPITEEEKFDFQKSSGNKDPDSPRGVKRKRKNHNPKKARKTPGKKREKARNSVLLKRI